MCYLCVGMHAMYFVKALFTGAGEDDLTEGKKLAYVDIFQVVKDTSTQRAFLLVINRVARRQNSSIANDEDLPDWEGGSDDRVIVESEQREATLEQIAICWQAEHMFRYYEVKKFPLYTGDFEKSRKEPVENSTLTKQKQNDKAQVQPFKGYSSGFQFGGYSFFMRDGFKSASGLNNGTWTHDTGWKVNYNAAKIDMPEGSELTVYVEDPRSMLELEASVSGEDDLRTVAMAYKHAVTEHVGQYYLLSNAAYNKRMNRLNDIAAWDGWEFTVRSKEFCFACVLFRRGYIPPICDTAQHIAVMLRCPPILDPVDGKMKMTQDMIEVIRDECCFVADTLAPVSDVRKIYKDIVQARLNQLQYTEDGYRWLEGQLGMMPVHRKTHAVRFVKALVKLVCEDKDDIHNAPEIKDAQALHDPMLVPKEMIALAEPLIAGAEEDAQQGQRQAWRERISRYLAHCVDGGIMGERFNLCELVRRGLEQNLTPDTDNTLRGVIEFLLCILPRPDSEKDKKEQKNEKALALKDLLKNPSKFCNHTFNEKVMRLLLSEGYIQHEWKRKAGGSGDEYYKLLASLLTSDHVGISLRTLICRQILEKTNERSEHGKLLDRNAQLVDVMVPALVQAMKGTNLSLTSCATAALVNLSCGDAATKTILVSSGAVKLLVKQLKMKDDDLTLYTLYLLINLTKTAHHRMIVIREGAVPLLVEVLTSSYQNPRKVKILEELSSVLGQLCNDGETRNQLSEQYPALLCFMWMFDQAQPNTRLKTTLMFALKQLCVLVRNKIKVGSQLIPKVFEEITLRCGPSCEEGVSNAVLLLQMLATINTCALMMTEDRMEQAGHKIKSLEKSHPHLKEKWMLLNDRVKEARVSQANSGLGG